MTAEAKPVDARGPRFQGAAMPRGEMRARNSPRTIDSLLMELQREPEAGLRERYPWADRFVMGLPLPSWQRDFKWSDEQCSRFITSIWCGVALGSYTVNQEMLEERLDKVVFAPMSSVVIDGQQRLMAIQKYVLDEITVPDADGVERLFSEVSQFERGRFGRTIFDRSEVESKNDDQLRSFYDMLNFGGIPHEPHERATRGARP